MTAEEETDEPDEFVYLKDLYDCAKVYALAAIKIFGVS